MTPETLLQARSAWLLGLASYRILRPWRARLMVAARVWGAAGVEVRRMRRALDELADDAREGAEAAEREAKRRGDAALEELNRIVDASRRIC